MDNPIVLMSLNKYITKKTAIRLKGVSKIMNHYVIPRDYSMNIQKFNFSDLNKIKMILDYSRGIKFKDICFFIKPFKFYCKTNYINYYKRYCICSNCFTILSQIHYNLIITFLVYRYFLGGYTENFLYPYDYYLHPNLVTELYDNLENTHNINFIYKLVNKYSYNWEYYELVFL